MAAMEFNELIKKITKPVTYPTGVPDAIDFVSKVLLQNFKDYLAPDSDTYFCALNPIFSMELEYTTDKRLSLVNVFLLRDGVMPLLKFFILNPRPLELSPVFIIDEAFSCLVPENWRSQVLLKRLRIKKEADANKKKKLFFISPIESAQPMDLFLNELEKLKKVIKETDELYVYFSPALLRASRETSLENKAWSHKLLATFLATFKNNMVQILDWNEYQSLSLKDFSYYLINPLQYYFSDSFMIHDCLFKGGTPLFLPSLPQVSGSVHYEAIGPDHGIELHQDFKPYQDFKAHLYKQAITELSLTEKDKTFSPRTLAIATKEFKDWAGDVARKLH